MEIIAEIGQNHNGDMVLAKELIYAAKENGADVAKFQLFDAPSLFPSDKPWFSYNCQTQLTKEQLYYIFEICEDVNIEFMASAFDCERVSWLEEINVRRYKIASRSIHDRALIEAISKTNKPVIASLGMWEELNFPIINANISGYLYCISKYPTPLNDLKLSSVDFNKYIGFSDHSIGITAACASFTLGAKIVEKHFTLDTNMTGPDHKGSMTPTDLANLSIFRNELVECL